MKHYASNQKHVTKAGQRLPYYRVVRHKTGSIGKSKQDEVDSQSRTADSDWSQVSDNDCVRSPQYSADPEVAYKREDESTDDETGENVSHAIWSPSLREPQNNALAMNQMLQPQNRLLVAETRVRTLTVTSEYKEETYQHLERRIVATQQELAATQDRTFQIGEEHCKLLTKNNKITNKLKCSQRKLERLDRFSHGQAIIIHGTRKERDTARAEVLTRDREILRLKEELLAAQATTGRTMAVVFQLKDELTARSAPSTG